MRERGSEGGKERGREGGRKGGKERGREGGGREGGGRERYAQRTVQQCPQTEAENTLNNIPTLKKREHSSILNLCARFQLL